MLAVLFLRTEATSEDQQQHAVSKLCSMVLSDEGNASEEVRNAIHYVNNWTIQIFLRTHSVRYSEVQREFQTQQLAILH